MSTDIIVPGADAPERKIVESPEGRSTRIAAGILLALLGLLLVVMAFTANPTGKIALSDAFADVQLPTIEVPGLPVLLFLALLTLASGAVFLIGRFPKDCRTAAGVIAGLSILVGFVVWAAASEGHGISFRIRSLESRNDNDIALVQLLVHTLWLKA